eukprot:scaffold19075_cov71-Phaeocystis_antarctica.AAC.2
MARSPRQHSVGASAPAVAKHTVARRKPIASGRTPASVAARYCAPNCVYTTMAMAHTTRIARASVGERARRRRKMPSGYITSHQKTLPMAASIDWFAPSMTAGAVPIADNAHPACPMTKLTRSRRPAADAPAARNTVLTAADLAAPEDREDEVGASWTATLDSAFPPRRSRRQPARPRSSRVGSRAMAMAVAKAIDCLQIFGKRGRGVAAGAQAGELGQPPRMRVEAHTAVARQSTPEPGPGVNPRAVLLVALIVVRLALMVADMVAVTVALMPVPIIGSVSRHATVPTLGGAEPRLVLVEPEPQAIRRSELCRNEVILRRRADAGRCPPVLLAQVHAAEKRGGALGRHEEAGGAGGRGGPAGWADSRRGGTEEEDGGGCQHANTDQHLTS